VLRRSSPTFAALALVLFSGALAACGGGSSGAGASPTASVPAVTGAPTGDPGAFVYGKSCARCHGGRGEGRGDAPPIDQVRLSTLGDQRLRLVIQYGKGRMPGFEGLTAEQVDQLIAYMMTF
jgi:mono/diheme cytochrome c family protein